MAVTAADLIQFVADRMGDDPGQVHDDTLVMVNVNGWATAVKSVRLSAPDDKGEVFIVLVPMSDMPTRSAE